MSYSVHGTDAGDAESSTTRTSFEDLSSELLASSFVSGTQMAKVLEENRKLKLQLEDTKKELDNAKKELQYKEMVKKMIDEDAEMHTRYWLPEEHQRFLVGLQKFGHKDMKAIAEYVGTRSTVQVRTHSQKYFLKLERHGKSLGDLGLPEAPCKDDDDDDDDEEESSSPSVKRARSPEKQITTSPPDSSAGSRDGGGKRPANSHPASSAHQSRPVSGDMAAFARVPNDPNSGLSQGPGYVLGAGFDISPSTGMVSGVGRGGLMFPHPFSTNHPVGGMQGCDPANAGGGMQGWNMPGARPIVNHPSGMQLGQPWQTNVNQVRMPVVGAQTQQAQVFAVPGQHGANSHTQAHGGAHPPGSGAGVAPGHGPGPGQQDHLSYLQNLN